MNSSRHDDISHFFWGGGLLSSTSSCLNDPVPVWPGWVFLRFIEGLTCSKWLFLQTERTTERGKITCGVQVKQLGSVSLIYKHAHTRTLDPILTPGSSSGTFHMDPSPLTGNLTTPPVSAFFVFLSLHQPPTSLSLGLRCNLWSFAGRS